MSTFLRLLTLTLAVSAAVACSTNVVGGDGSGGAGAACTKGAIHADSFDQSCSNDTDCAPVYQGSLCTQCLCPTAAISQGALTAYNAAIEASDPPTDVCNCPAFKPPACIEGVCVLP
jgi:hypothetical protein